MAFTPEERTAWLAAVNETALAIDDRVNATTNAARLAARTRYINGMQAFTLVILNAVKNGVQGDYV